MFENGKNHQLCDRRDPGGIRLSLGGSAERECRPGPGRQGQLCLLALGDPVHPDLLLQEGRPLGDFRPDGRPDPTNEKTGRKVFVEQKPILEHHQGGARPGRPIYIETHSN